MRVLLADPVSARCETLLRDAGLEVDNRPGLQGEELRAAVGPVEGIIVRSATKVGESLLEAAPALRVIGRAGTGVDNIDVDAATLRGVVVMNAPGENTLSAAEHTLAMLLALCRNLPAADRRLREGGWGKAGLTGVELYGKTLGVLGLGRIGREVAQRARAFGLEVLACDPFLPAETAAKLDLAALELDEVLDRADFLTVHVPLTERTRHLLGAEAFAACKRGVRVVNCARGGIVDELALLAALESGQVAGAALDVFEAEPLPEDHPLRSHPKVVLTPHLGASTLEAQDKVAVRIAEQVADYLCSGAVRNAVNAPSLDPAAAARLQPFQRLAECIGLLQARLLDGGFRELRIETAGAVLDLSTRSITAAVLKGFLGEVLSQPVNVVNAEALARANDYPFTEVRSSEPGDYASLVRVTLGTDGCERVVEGTLLGHRFPRIVRVDDFTVDAEPRGEMLLSGSADRPGVLGAIASTIAGGNVNIANLSLGRDRTGHKALSLISLDSPLPAETLEALRHVDGMEWVLPVSFGREG